jgi:hypothetical protein
MQPQKVSLARDANRFGWSDQGDFADFDVEKVNPKSHDRADRPTFVVAVYASSDRFFRPPHDKFQKCDLQI